MSSVELRQLHKSFGSFEAVRNVDVNIEEGEFFTILGPSGCGKTTCLRIIAGFISPTRGRVFLGGRDVTRQPPYRRNVGMVFQSYALFPHLSAARNIAFGLEARKVSKPELQERVAQALALVQPEDLKDRFPHELSGGQKQRVALARAIAIRPEVLLLDEPLSALDLQLRQELRVGIKKVHKQLGLTTLLVTHDQGEALSMSDRIGVMSAGQMLQIDLPSQIYRHPRSRAVADFIGKINLLPCRIMQILADGRHQVELCGEESSPIEIVPRGTSRFRAGDRCLFGIRPEDVKVATGSGPGLVMTAASIDYLGNSWSVECVTRSGARFFVQMSSSEQVPTPGTSINIAWGPASGFLLPSDTQA
jgi:putative spermidine/putrescine transport system ATP-binding protein